MIQGLGEILQFQQAPRLRDHFLALSDQVAAARAPLQHDLARLSAMLEITTGLGGLAVALTGVWLAGRGEIAIAIVPLLSVIAMAAFLQVSEIAQAARQLAETYGAARRLAGVHRTRPVVADTGAAASPATGDLVFAGARFTYPTGVRPALDGLDLAVAAGATVALVGPSGAGKSTVANLALRFFDPAEGRVSLGGVDLRDLPLDILRGQVSLVAQDVFLFDASLGDNVRLARPEASDAEVMAALDRAALGDFARALPEGLATRVGERGARLSGGQRQRVGIARAFLKDAPILILDEATSHLDAISEAEVRQALTELKRGRATLVIAHRLSTVRDADLIAVLDRGRVVEQGGHAALLAAGGLYARLVGRQRALAAD
jgi:ATP-binding cassette subfamily C protein CydCD